MLGSRSPLVLQLHDGWWNINLQQQSEFEQNYFGKYSLKNEKKILNWHFFYKKLIPLDKFILKRGIFLKNAKLAFFIKIQMLKNCTLKCDTLNQTS